MFKNFLQLLTLLTFLIGTSNAMESYPREREAISHPAGSVIAFAGKTPPRGWLLCNGEQYSNQEYPKLYQAIGTKYVGTGSWVIEANKRSRLEKYFSVPDLRGRVIVGVDSGGMRVTSNNKLGESSGEENHQITVPELPIHSHQMFDAITGSGALPTTTVLSGRNPNLRCSAFTENTGGDQPHNNMQPYQILNYIINTGNPVTPVGIIMEYCGESDKWLKGAAFYVHEILYNIRAIGREKPIGKKEPKQSSVIQVITSFSQDAKSTSTVIPNDRTIPQNTEGTELITTTISPKSPKSTLMIDFSCPIVGNQSYATNVFALFQDNIVNALNAGFCVCESISRGQPFFMRHTVTSGTTNPTTFKIRFGTSLGTMYILRSQDGTVTYGGIPQYSLTVTEISS